MYDPQVGDIWYSPGSQAHFMVTRIVRRYNKWGHRYFILWLDNGWGEDETDISCFPNYRWVA